MGKAAETIFLCLVGGWIYRDCRGRRLAVCQPAANATWGFAGSPPADPGSIKSARVWADRDGNPNQDFGRTTNIVGAQIAPKAFEGSKGILDSTLEHEVGGHVGQLINHTFSEAGPGNYMNEVEAYDRELRHAKEHGLTDDEIGGIHGNRNWYFNQLDTENQARINKGIYTPRK
jgi:hypothetical protein